jgi:hypothetical protein
MRKSPVFAVLAAAVVAIGAPFVAIAEDPARDTAAVAAGQPQAEASVSPEDANAPAARGQSGGRGLYALPEVDDEAKPGGCKACAWLRENPPDEDSAGRRAPDGPAAPAARGQPSNRGYVVGKGGVARATPGGGTPEPTQTEASPEKAELAVEAVERSPRPPAKGP